MENSVVEYLQKIQGDLVGIIIPVIITAIISLITMIVNSILKIMLENRKYNSEQYKIMQRFYPELKIILLELRFTLLELKNNSIYSDINKAIEKYVQFSRNETAYRKEYINEGSHIDSFIKQMRTYKKYMIDINKTLFEREIPAPPIMKPILRYNVNKMILELQCNSVLWKKYESNSMNDQFFLEEIKNAGNKQGAEINYERINKYISCLDKWFSKY